MPINLCTRAMNRSEKRENEKKTLDRERYTRGAGRVGSNACRGRAKNWQIGAILEDKLKNKGTFCASEGPEARVISIRHVA